MTRTNDRPRVARTLLLVALSPAVLAAAVLTLAVDRLGAMLDPAEGEFGSCTDDDGLWEEVPEQVTEQQPELSAAR